MMRLLATLSTLVLFALPLLSTPRLPVAAIGFVAAVLAAVGIASLWPWFVTAAACVFLVEYAAALIVAAGAIDLVSAAGFSLALFLLLHAADFARRGRHAAVDASVVVAHVRRWTGLCLSALVGASLALVMAGVLAGALPFAGSPFLAAIGALGTLLALAAVMRRAARRQES